MRQGAWAVALVGLLASVAGCADNAANTPDIAVPDSIQDVEVTDDTGALRGIVLDEKITPISGVKITVAGVQEAQTTAEDGGFAFSGLAAGDYFISAEKAGYTPIQSSGTVVAGDANPPLIKVLMAVDAATAPFVELQNWKAFLQCGVGVPVGGSWNPCLFTGSDNVHYFAFGSGSLPAFGQAEAVWTGTQPMGNTLWFQFGSKAGVGESPFVHQLDAEGLDDSAGDDDEQIMVRVFAGDESPTLVINQAYDIYVSYFYNFVPREGYMFAVDGPCDPPEKCK